MGIGLNLAYCASISIDCRSFPGPSPRHLPNWVLGGLNRRGDGEAVDSGNNRIFCTHFRNPILANKHAIKSGAENLALARLILSV